mmetsp:Transcript_19024/g.31733  ORF Transcript_19024/g.31733 Transcript_19024/m.31733 type:complete len:94 (-) Transcript_19024:404-685(-)
MDASGKLIQPDQVVGYVDRSEDLGARIMDLLCVSLGLSVSLGQACSGRSRSCRDSGRRSAHSQGYVLGAWLPLVRDQPTADRAAGRRSVAKGM